MILIPRLCRAAAAESRVMGIQCLVVVQGLLQVRLICFTANPKKPACRPVSIFMRHTITSPSWITSIPITTRTMQHQPTYLTNEDGEFLSHCCLIILNNTTYILAPDCFEQAYFNNILVTPCKKSARHFYSLSPISGLQDEEPYEIEPVSFEKKIPVVVNKRVSTITQWFVRDNGTYVLQLLHMADPRRNGLPVFDMETEQIIGMYLSTNWFRDHATVLPIDVVSDKPEIQIEPIFVSTSGYVHKHGIYLKDPSDFRMFDIDAERGVLASYEQTINASPRRDPPPPCGLCTDAAIEAFGMVFCIDKDNRIMRVLDYSNPFPINALCNEVRTVNNVENMTPYKFFKTIQRSSEEKITIEWINGDQEWYAPKLTESNLYFHVWRELPLENFVEDLLLGSGSPDDPDTPDSQKTSTAAASVEEEQITSESPTQAQDSAHVDSLVVEDHAAIEGKVEDKPGEDMKGTEDVDVCGDF